MSVIDAAGVGLGAPPAVVAHEVSDGGVALTERNVGFFRRCWEALFGARVDDDLTQKEHKVPPLALVLSILGGLGYLAYIGHTEIIYLGQVNWTFKAAPGFLLALLLAQDIGSDWSMLRSMPRFAVYIRRSSWTYRWLAIEMLLYILTVGGTMTLTLYGIASATDQNPGAVISSAPLVSPSDPMFNAIMILRAVLFFWTMLQLVLTAGKIPADMLTMKEMWIGKLGAYVREVLMAMKVNKQQLAPSLRVFSAALANQSDADFANAVQEFGEDTDKKIREEEARKVRAEMEAETRRILAEHEARYQQDRERFMGEIEDRDVQFQRVTAAVSATLYALAGGEEVPDDAISALPELGMLARLVRRRPVPARSGEATVRQPRAEAPSDDDLPLGAIKVTGKPFGTTKNAVALVATASSAMRLVNVKDDTLRGWILKANASAGSGDGWVAGPRGAQCMPYVLMLDLIAANASDKVREGVDLDALRQQAEDWGAKAAA